MGLEARACTPLLKGPSRRQEKARKGRAEKKVEQAVRAACVERDRICRVAKAALMDCVGNLLIAVIETGCDGPLEWAHLKGHRRSQTRGMAPEIRHTTAKSLLLCRRHHQDEEAGRLRITALTRKGCDGPMKFERVS